MAEAAAPEVPAKQDYEPPKARPVCPDDFDGYEFLADPLGSKRHPDPESVIRAKLDACVQVARTGASIRGCALAGISTHFRAKWMEADKVWCEALTAAEIMHKETCEASARRQCFEGQKVMKRGGRDQQGRIIYREERKYGDPMLAGRLLAAMDGKYRERGGGDQAGGQAGIGNVFIGSEFAAGLLQNLMGDRFATAIDTTAVKNLLPASKDD